MSEDDCAGNVQNETDTQQSVATTTTYSYDGANQLLSAGTLSYSYDANGNRPNADASPVTANQVSNDASWTYTYDANGNLSEEYTTTAMSDEHWTYAYDNKNELTEVKHYNSSITLVLTVEYKYDVFGNLIEEDASNGVSTTTTKFAVDGWNSNMAAPIGLENFNDWAVLNSDNSLQTRNLFGNNVDQVLGRVDQTGATDSAGQYWDLTDHLGSVRDVVNSGGTVKDSVAYDAYGNVIGTDVHANYRGMYDWTGRQVDVETGLQYNRARWYDSTTGRWISQDPMGFDAGDSNLYRYVANALCYRIDPSGMDVYLETYGGSSNVGEGTSDWLCSPINAFHQRITVDTWEGKGKLAHKTGKKSFSFRQVSGISLPWFSRTWLGFNSWQEGGCSTGKVYEDTSKESYRIDKQKKTTQEEDARILDILMKKVGTEAEYTIDNFHTCRGFSQRSFAQVVGTPVQLAPQPPPGPPRLR